MTSIELSRHIRLIGIGIAATVSLALITGLIKKKLKIRNKLEKVALRQSKAKDQRMRLHHRLLEYEKGHEVLLTKARRAILSMECDQLLEKLWKGDLKPLQVLQAYQAAALIATEKKNCVCLFIEEAEEWARDLEAIRPEDRGPLFGIPISVKECFIIKGYDHTIGLTKFIDDPSREDGSMIKYVKKLGAIPFCLTNVPQTMKGFGCANPVYGRTLNPYSDFRTPGGSSGGEACLLAMQGSILGLGTDVGGSVRLPSAFCGTVALKPTSNRLPESGRKTSLTGQLIGVKSNAGLMTRDVTTLVQAMRHFLAEPRIMQRYDPLAVPFAWNEKIFAEEGKLKIGWYDSQENIEPVPACKRAVREVLELLKADGHTVKPVPTKWINLASELYLDLFFSDDGVNHLEFLQDEIIDEDLRLQMIMWKLPRTFKKNFLSWLMDTQSKMKGHILRRGIENAAEMWTHMGTLEKLRTQILDYWNDHEFDVIIGPGTACPAPRNENVKKILPIAYITAPYNIINFPSGALPITNVNEQDIQDFNDWPSRDNPHHGDQVYKVLAKDSEDSEGMPVGVQVIGKPWEEEKILKVMSIIEKLRDQKGLFNPLKTIDGIL